MCGIVGIASPTRLDQPELLDGARDCLAHRGPDHAATWWSSDGRVGLAHRRLAIIDLSPAGEQPMADISGTLQIILNGEIYNFKELRDELVCLGYRFRSQSDTEVVLQAYRAWGTSCLERLNGMFAFALYDGTARSLLLARDRAGEKPLFYRQTAERLLFASELKALLVNPEFPRALDLEALNFYLAYGYVPGTRCIIAGVHKLAPAHALLYDCDSGSARVWRYWDLPEPFEGTAPPVGELLDELEALLTDAVARQLVADVPVGVLLSGGVDSSLVTAMAVRASSRPVKTFTVCVPGDTAYDEGPYARLVAEYFGTEHTELTADPATVDLLPQLARQYDEPIADQSVVPTYLVARLIRQHATVALGGDGGDELFGGYTAYSWALRQQRVRAYVPAPIRRLVSAGAAPLPVGFRGRTPLLAFGLDEPTAAAHSGLYFDHATRRALAPALRGLNALAPEQNRLCSGSRGRSIVQRLTMADFATYLPDNILVKVDRASMLTSLEVRAPFLDHRIVSFAFGRVPDAYRATPMARKILLRRLGQRLLPPALDLKRKRGFVLPLARWFKGEWGTFIEDVLRQANPAVFDGKVLGRLLDNQRRGYSNAQRLYALAMFELWRREYRITLPTD